LDAMGGDGHLDDWDALAYSELEVRVAKRQGGEGEGGEEAKEEREIVTEEKESKEREIIREAERSKMDKKGEEITINKRNNCQMNYNASSSKTNGNGLSKSSNGGQNDEATKHITELCSKFGSNPGPNFGSDFEFKALLRELLRHLQTETVVMGKDGDEEQYSLVNKPGVMDLDIGRREGRKAMEGEEREGKGEGEGEGGESEGGGKKIKSQKNEPKTNENENENENRRERIEEKSPCCVSSAASILSPLPPLTPSPPPLSPPPPPLSPPRTSPPQPPSLQAQLKLEWQNLQQAYFVAAYSRAICRSSATAAKATAAAAATQKERENEILKLWKFVEDQNQKIATLVSKQNERIVSLTERNKQLEWKLKQQTAMSVIIQRAQRERPRLLMDQEREEEEKERRGEEEREVIGDKEREISDKEKNITPSTSPPLPSTLMSCPEPSASPPPPPKPIPDRQIRGSSFLAAHLQASHRSIASRIRFLGSVVPPNSPSNRNNNLSSHHYNNNMNQKGPPKFHLRQHHPNHFNSNTIKHTNNLESDDSPILNNPSSYRIQNPIKLSLNHSDPTIVMDLVSDEDGETEKEKSLSKEKENSDQNTPEEEEEQMEVKRVEEK